MTAGLLIAFAVPAPAQPDEGEESPPREAGSAFEIAAFAGALRIDDDFSLDADGRWISVAGARAGIRPAPQVTLSAEAWFGSSHRGFGGFASVRPWIGRGWPADPAFDFGLESIDGDDEEERGPGFVFGLGIERALGRRGALHAAVRQHFLTIDEEEVDGVATGRNSELWEVRAGLSLLLDGNLSPIVAEM
ncbi:MAG TPA: hypothetical protein VFH11_04040 [Gemmatimonadota bacterium]|nr:hypothetical protein [Gemmatimonadota bacterium]